MSSEHDPGRPYDPTTGLALPPRAQPGYYPGYSTLAQRAFWDAATRAVVLDRVENVPPLRYFDEAQAATLEAVCARILPQDDREPARRIPIAPQIDRRLYRNESDGYRYEDMPPDGEAYRIALRALDAGARAAHGCDFAALDVGRSEALLVQLHDGTAPAPHEAWRGLNVGRFWTMLVADCSEAYYSHPWAWDEIGYGGPAYPRAYTRLERGEPESWEVDERRYAWAPPPESISGIERPPASDSEHFGSAGQGGTH